MVWPGAALLGQSASQASDAAKRLQWLNSRLPPKDAVAPKSTPAKVATAPKVGFRSSPHAISARTPEIPPVEAAPAPTPPAEKRLAESSPAEPLPTKSEPAAVSPPKTRPEGRLAKTTPPPSAKTTPAPLAKTTTPADVATPSPAKTRTAEGRFAKTTPPPTSKTTPAPLAKAPTPAVVAEPSPSKNRAAEARVAKATPPPKATPALVAKLTTPSAITELPPAKSRPTETRSTTVPKPTMAPALTAMSAMKPSLNKPELPVPPAPPVKGRFPWKTGIVTTVFWIGEPPSGNNFTPNHSSSWDVNWAQNYGGFDNPDPAARRNFLPARFTPRLNPFYVALPYNDVTRGTTKPEARRAIPWFREEFEREGQSVCRDRWVAIRNRAGQIAYAQWSDCGPFRTDHWQYVFGNERPKPNLNQGAGLDVSPAVRDYLGLDGHDVTDWKFVEFKEVPHGPWARHGENNDFVMKGTRPGKSGAAATDRRADNATRLRLGGM